VFLESAETIATSCQDGKVRLFDLKKRAEIAQIPLQHTEFGDELATMAAAQDGKTIYVCQQHSIEAWDARGKKRLWRSEHPNLKVGFSSIAVSPDSTMIAAQCAYDETLLFSTRTGQQIGVSSRLGRNLHDGVFSNDSKRLLITSMSDVSILNVASLKTELVIERRVAKELCNSAWSADAKVIGIVSSDKTVSLWNAQSGALVHEFKGHEAIPTHIRFLKDDTMLTADTSGRVLHWSIGQKRILLRLKCSDGDIIDLALSPDGKRFAVACANGDVVIFELEKR
jgi:WD40 repeat protein